MLARAAIFSLVVCGVVLAQAPERSKQTGRQEPEVRKEAKLVDKRPVEVLNILNDAKSAPPEFGADVILKLVKSTKVADREWKKELLEDAFRLAGKGEQKVKRDYAGAYVDTKEGYLSQALQLKLDVLSLQSRVVTEMLALDKSRAREMFLEISPNMKLPPLGCSDVLVPDVTDFYLLMRRVAQETFSAEEIKSGLQVPFVQHYVEAISSPVQVGPIARALSAGDYSALQLSILLQSFTDAIKRIESDYRTFWHAATRDAVTVGLHELVAVCDRKGVPRDEFVKASRAYLVKSFSTQCADNTVKRKGEVPAFIKIANQEMLQTNPILFDEIQPVVVGEKFSTVSFWQSAKSKDMLLDLKRLRFGPDQKQRPDSEKTTAAWHQQLTDYLNQLDSWSANDEHSEVEYFHQKAIAYRALTDLVPSGIVRENIWRSQATFIASGYMQDARIEWFLHAGDLLAQIRKASPPDRQALLKILEVSPNNVLRTYAQFYEIVPN